MNRHRHIASVKATQSCTENKVTVHHITANLSQLAWT